MNLHRLVGMELGFLGGYRDSRELSWIVVRGRMIAGYLHLCSNWCM